VQIRGEPMALCLPEPGLKHPPDERTGTILPFSPHPSAFYAAALCRIPSSLQPLRISLPCPLLDTASSHPLSNFPETLPENILKFRLELVAQGRIA